MNPIARSLSPRRLATLALLTLLTWAAAPAPVRAEAKLAKIAVVDVETVTRRSSTIQGAIQQAEGDVKAQQDKIESRVKDLERMNQELRDRRSVMKADEIEAQERKIREQRNQIEDLQYEVNKQLARIREQIMDPEVERIMTTVEQVARQEGYDIVLRAEAVLFHTEAVDLTPLVIQALDRAGARPASALPSQTAPKTDAAADAKPKADAKADAKSGDKPAARDAKPRRASE